MTAIVDPTPFINTAVLPLQDSLTVSLSLKPLALIGRHIFQPDLVDSDRSGRGHTERNHLIIVISESFSNHFFFVCKGFSVIWCFGHIFTHLLSFDRVTALALRSPLRGLLVQRIGTICFCDFLEGNLVDLLNQALGNILVRFFFFSEDSLWTLSYFHTWLAQILLFAYRFVLQGRLLMKWKFFSGTRDWWIRRLLQFLSNFVT